MLHVLFDLLLGARTLSSPQALRLPPFAKNAKDGAPAVLLMAARSKVWTTRPQRVLDTADIVREAMLRHLRG
jgi:hypothetical protein